MAGNFEYYAEMGLNAGAAINELSRVAATADTVTKNLDALDKALDQVGKGKGGKGLVSGAEHKQLQDTLGLYQQLATAVAAYGRSLKTINSTDLNNGVRKTNTSLDHMDKALSRVSGTEKETFDAKKRTLDLYKQMTGATKAQADTLRAEADAIKAVAQAERTRQATAAAATRPDGTDMWGVTKEERDQRRMAQVVMQAEREMNAEFERRAQAHMKANAEAQKKTEAERAAAEATKTHADATAQSADEMDNQERALASSRYALYEIAAAYTAVSAAALALPVASAKTAIEMEAQFAHVRRTTQGLDAPMQSLYNQFVDISTEIPVAFEELSRIGTLGAQMGIAASDLTSFSETVAKFAATTNVSADEAAMYFGRLSNMLDDVDESTYNNLGSAVSELGTASVATEKEILAVAESIATTANMAGFSADEVAGLATAMASLRIRPEMARGAMQRVFAKINVAVGEGNETLDEYARLLGVSAAQADALWRNDPSQFFMRVNEQLSQMDDNVAKSIYMREQLQITNIRDVELLSRLSNGYETYASSMDLAQDAYARGTYLDEESGVIFDTTAAALQRLGAAFKGMVGAFGQDSLKPITVTAEILIGILNWVRDMPTPLKSTAVALSALVGVFAAFKATMALSMASMYAFQLLAKNMGVTPVVSFNRLLTTASTTFPGIKTLVDRASLALTNFRVQLGAAQGAMAKTAVAARGMGAAFMAAGPVGWALMAAGAATALISMAAAHETAAEKAKAHAQTFIESAGGMDSLMAALKQDAEALASGEQTEVIGRLNLRMAEMEPVATSAAGALRDQLIPAHEEQADAVRETTDAYIEGMGAIGEYTDAWMREGLVKALSEKINSEDITSLVERGFDFDTLVALWQTEGQSAAQAYAKEFSNSLMQEYERHYGANNYAADQAAALEGTIIRNAGLAAKVISEELVDLDSGLDEINSKYLLGQQLGVDMFDELSEGADSLGGSFEEVNNELSTFVDGLFGIVNAEAAVYEAMQSLGESLDEHGTSFDVATEAGRANMQEFQNFLGTITAELEEKVAKGLLTQQEALNQFSLDYGLLMDELAAMGVDTSQFDAFKAHIEDLFSDPTHVQVDTVEAITDLQTLSAEAQTALGWLANLADAMGGKGYARLTKPGDTVVGTPAGPTSAQRARVEYEQRMRTNERGERLQAVNAARARAEQERLAKAAEDAAKETKRQADEQKKAADEAKKLREEIADAKDEGRIFEEIMKGLSSAFQETLHNFNQFQSARDTVEQHLINMRNAAQDSADKVRDLREEYRRLRQEASEDRVEARQAESFAAVARRYGDTERAVDYTTQAKGARANAAEKERLAREALNEANAIEKNRLSLKGYSEQAIKNRGDVRALQERMTDLILAYAETGATTEEVTRYTEQLRRKFIDQLVQMGYNRSDAERLSRVFQNLKTDIDRIPRQVRIEAQARVKEAEAALRNVARGRTATIDIKPRQRELSISGNIRTNDIIVGKQVKAPTFDVGRVVDYGNGITSNWARAGGGLIPGPSFGPSHRDNRLVVGPNGPEGTIRTGEFVIRKPAVDAIGLNALHALNSMSPGAAVMSSAPAVNASRGIQLVELLPHQVHQLAQAVSTVLAVDGKVLAGTTNAQNTNDARRGVR